MKSVKLFINILILILCYHLRLLINYTIFLSDGLAEVGPSNESGVLMQQGFTLQPRDTDTTVYPVVVQTMAYYDIGQTTVKQTRLVSH